MSAPGPSTADEIQRLLPDLARTFQADGRPEGDGYACTPTTVTEGLRRRGHRDTLIEAVLRQTWPDPPPGPELIATAAQIRGWGSIALALSGGGLRATLFELGILLYLAEAGELPQVTGIVSVSGGSILAAHVAIRWRQASQNVAGFVAAAAELIRFARRDIRNRSVSRWLWSRLLVYPLFRRGWSRIDFLTQEYRHHFGDTTLGDLPRGSDVPQVFFVATDTQKQHRVALSSEGIVRFNFAGEPVERVILGNGTPVAVAVATSSCFPPFFNFVPLTHTELDLTYAEFDGELSLRDGGVAGNLGVEVLAALIQQGQFPATRIFACDAEKGLAEKPSGLLEVTDAQGAALSESARRTFEKLGVNAKMLSFSRRTEGALGLPFVVATALSKYRTDLDRPSWAGCYALLLHGAAVTADALASRLAQPPAPEAVRTAAREILQAAGCPEDLAEPTKKALGGCGRRKYRRPILHILAILLTGFVVYGGICEAAAWASPSWRHRPLKSLWLALRPEPITPRDFDPLADEVAAAACGGSVADLERSLADGGLSQVRIVLADQSGVSAVYARKTVRPQGCAHEVECQFTFRGDFSEATIRPGDTAEIVGRIAKITASGEKRNAYLDFVDCRLK